MICFFPRRRKRKRKRIKRKGSNKDDNKEKDMQMTWKKIVIVLKRELPKTKGMMKLVKLQTKRNHELEWYNVFTKKPNAS